MVRMTHILANHKEGPSLILEGAILEHRQVWAYLNASAKAAITKYQKMIIEEKEGCRRLYRSNQEILDYKKENKYNGLNLMKETGYNNPKYCFVWLFRK